MSLIMDVSYRPCPATQSSVGSTAGTCSKLTLAVQVLSLEPQLTDLQCSSVSDCGNSSLRRFSENGCREVSLEITSLSTSFSMESMRLELSPSTKANSQCTERGTTSSQKIPVSKYPTIAPSSDWNTELGGWRFKQLYLEKCSIVVQVTRYKPLAVKMGSVAICEHRRKQKFFYAPIL